MRGSWATKERIAYSLLRDFNLKVGDKVIFPNPTLRRGDEVEQRRSVATGEVVGIYPHIFHVKYYLNTDNEVVMYTSFRRIDYQLGEVTKYESYGEA